MIGPQVPGTTPTAPSAPAIPAAPVALITDRTASVAGSGVVARATVPQAAVSPTFGATRVAAASPTALPFTGGTTALLLALGTGLVVAGGGLVVSGRREKSMATTA